MRKVLIVAAAVLLASCGGNLRDKVTVVSAANVEMETLSKATVTLTVDNSSCHKIRIFDGRLRLHTDRGDIATVLLNEEITIPRKAVTELKVPLRIRFNDPLAALGIPSGVMVSGEARVRMGPLRKKIYVRDEPVSEFIDNFAE